MKQTKSENDTSLINESLFYKEFTFDKNDFYPADGKKELADNVMILDELLFIIQIKERNLIDSKVNVDDWFENKVLKKAKKQVKNTLEYLEKYDKIPIINRREQVIDVSKLKFTKINKIIIYQTDEELKEENRTLKFYKSSVNGNIHIFNLKDYYWICKYLITPTELDEYLKFRELICFKHKSIIDKYPEQYLLAHFLNTEDVTLIKPEYIHILTNLKNDVSEFDLSGFINKFSENIIEDNKTSKIEYHSIIKEIGKLKRYELLEFKQRLIKTIEDSKSNQQKLPLRFASLRTSCGFVFTPITKPYHDKWKDILRNSTEIFKHKHKLQKCIGITISKKENFLDINWGLMSYEWKENSELDELIKQETQPYGLPEYKTLERYRKKD